MSLFPKVETPIGDVLLEVEGLTRVGVFGDVSFTVRDGEILGFAGLVGAGRTTAPPATIGTALDDEDEVGDDEPLEPAAASVSDGAGVEPGVVPSVVAATIAAPRNGPVTS